MRRHHARHHRRSIRLEEYDYSQPGAYFVTVCAWNRECVFGEIIAGRMRLNPYGRIVQEGWKKTTRLRRNICLDTFVIMPNHVHGILFIQRRGVLQYAPMHRIKFRSPSQTIGVIIRGFKSSATKRINIKRNSPGVQIWQRGFYDHVIRNEKDLNRIRQYILYNPSNWALDAENPDRHKSNPDRT